MKPLPVLDQRDPIGGERLHSGETERALGLTRYGMPISVSGVCCRNDTEAARVVADLQAHARKLMRAWARCARPENKSADLGGSGCSYPIAIVLSNYGACIASDESKARIEYFRKD